MNANQYSNDYSPLIPNTPVHKAAVAARREMVGNLADRHPKIVQRKGGIIDGTTRHDRRVENNFNIIRKAAKKAN